MSISFTFPFTFSSHPRNESAVVPARTLTAMLHFMEKAPLSMLVTDDGIVILSIDLHPSKASSPIYVMDEGILSDASEPQFSKARFMMLVTEVGMSRLVKEEQP